MLFSCASAVFAQQQEQKMLDRIMNPDRDRANPMGEKAFTSKPFEGREFRGTGEFTGIKTARTKEFVTREFLGVRNPWFGKKVYATEEAKDLHRYVVADRDYASRAVETRAVNDSEKAARIDSRTEAEAGRAFLGRGKAQAAISAQNPSQGPLTVDEVRELLNRPR
jgi:hypothetical protein